MVQVYYAHRGVYRIVPVKETNNNDRTATTSTSTSDDNGGNSGGGRRLSRVSVVSPTGQFFSSSTFDDTDNNFNIDNNPTSSATTTSASTSTTNDDEHAVEVTPEQLEPAPSATFYPLLVQLMKRGDEAAHATKEFLQTKEVSDVMVKAKDYTQEKGQQVMTAALDKADATDIDVSSSSDAMAQKVKGAAQTEQVQQLMKMLKTEDLTVLLEKGKERLEQLLHDDIPEATKTALEKTGIRIVDDNDSNSPDGKSSSYKTAIVQSRKAALQAMQKVLDQANVNPDDINAIQQSLE